MSLQRVVEEVVRPHLRQVEEKNPDERIAQILEELKRSGAAIPQVAAVMEPEDLHKTGLPPAVLRLLVSELKRDTVPRMAAANDSHGCLRPTSLDQIVGHVGFKELITDSIIAARKNNEALRHVLLTGPRGIGKTTLAFGIAHERGVNLHALTGVQLQKPAEMVREVLRWKPLEIVFIDEIHGMGKQAQEMLYGVMEDGTLPVTEQRKGGAQKVTVPAAKVTIIGATTHPSKLLQPFRNRFGIVYSLPFYNEEELVQIARRTCSILKISVCDDGIIRLVKSCRDNPRTLNHFFVQLQDASVARSQTTMDTASVDRILTLNGYGTDGLRQEERRYLDVLGTMGQAGLQTIARALDIPIEEVEQTIEPWLVRTGRVRISGRGRSINTQPKGVS